MKRPARGEAGEARPAASAAAQPKAGKPRTARSAVALSSRRPRLRWSTPLLFALLAPGLFMLLDMSFEQATQASGFSPARLWSWIAGDGFFVLKAVYGLGVLPAAFAGLLIARRDQHDGASPRFALAVFALFGLPVGVLFARNLFLFTPPPISDQILIGARVVVGVVISGLVCYALTRWIARGRR